MRTRLDLSQCTKLKSLPQGLTTSALFLRDCDSLMELPEDLRVYFLDISGCTGLKEWPRRGVLEVGSLIMRNCSQFNEVPPRVRSLAQLDLRGCAGISELPAKLLVTSWLDIAGTAITKIPDGLKHVELRWKGVPVDERIAFRPDTISVSEVLQERNVERRRILLERVGYDRFLSESKAEVLDVDMDAGGERRLLKVSIPGDEDLVCLAVTCPSTRRRYMLRVPPATRRCKQAAAWIAGFDDPSKYRPLQET